jgi:hypothetical protein
MSDRMVAATARGIRRHGTAGCSQAALGRTHGIGLYYCFAIN